MSTPLAPAFVARRSAKREPLVQPFLKWAGGKRQLLAAIRPLIPTKIDRYYEPFVGGGAVLFDLQPRSAVINDCNAELVNCYTMIRDHPEELFLEVEKFANTREAFYDIRERDRNPDFVSLPPIERAARLLYLNKTCYNGLFRVNSQGQFNVPFGNYRNPLIADPAVIRAVSRYLNASGVTLLNTDFGEALKDTKRGDFVYMDPPYDPVSDTSSFTGYNLNGFDRAEQCRLKEVCDTLTTRGVKVLLSNSDTPFIRDLYASKEYAIHTVQARRNINSVAAKRGKVDEVFILNYSV
ncbi:MAG: DNA adenine methylase [Armatimonadetes bacterium]|nr:DNA adenine methylase [Armatimonadota bacterium]